MQVVQRGAGSDAGLPLRRCAAFLSPDCDVRSQLASDAALVAAERGRRWRLRIMICTRFKNWRSVLLSLHGALVFLWCSFKTTVVPLFHTLTRSTCSRPNKTEDRLYSRSNINPARQKVQQ